MKSIALIGMPGSGKSEIGKALAEKIGYNFIDMDEYIEFISCKKIADIFEEGEEVFRNYESEACVLLGNMKSSVISSGGGVVKRAKNILNLKKNSVIVFIDRPLNDIADDINLQTRPLLKGGMGRLYELYNERIELYRNLCDFEVGNGSTIDDCVKKIIKEYLRRYG